jgi:hypothetical protein
VTETELRAQLADLRVALARVETTLVGIAKANEGGDELHRDHEDRIRRLEKWMYALTGLAALTGSAAGQILPKMLGG